MAATMKGAFASVLPSFRPRIKRKHLRKYSWLPDVLRIKGSIISRIYGPVLTVTIWALLVCYADSKGKKIMMINSVVPLLSVVVGLILVFRNGTSYDRYWDGRKSFATMTSHIRNFSRLIWVNVGLPPDSPMIGKPSSTLTVVQLRKRKIEALQLCLAFAYAVKHYLRGEDGVRHEDLISVLPKAFTRYNDTSYNNQRIMNPNTYASTTNGSNSLSGSMIDDAPSGRSSPDATIRGTADATKRVRPKRSKPKLTGANAPLLGHRTIDFPPEDLSLPLPLVIAHELTRALYRFRRDGCLETVGPAGANASFKLLFHVLAMNVIVQGMVDQLTSMERVANTPIPISYGIHLKQCVTLYLFALPFTLVHDMGWATVPIVTVVAFTFMGIEGIADEIEMPFGTDTSDLPLDTYCDDLKEEIQYTIERLPEGGEGGYGFDDGEGDD